MVEAAGVEFENRPIDNLLMARDFWLEFVDTVAVAASPHLYLRPHESAVFDLILGEIMEAAGPDSRRPRVRGGGESAFPVPYVHRPKWSHCVVRGGHRREANEPADTARLRGRYAVAEFLSATVRTASV
jgi:hypothetical protein